MRFLQAYRKSNLPTKCNSKRSHPTAGSPFSPVVRLQLAQHLLPIPLARLHDFFTHMEAILTHLTVGKIVNSGRTGEPERENEHGVELCVVQVRATNGDSRRRKRHADELSELSEERKHDILRNRPYARLFSIENIP